MRHDHDTGFNPALLDALALCFAEAAVDQLVAEQLTEGYSPMPVKIDSVTCHVGDVRRWLATHLPSAS
jgi:hypothetical protein